MDNHSQLPSLLPDEILIHVFSYIPYRADICSVSKWWYDLVLRCSMGLSKFPELYLEVQSRPITAYISLANEIILFGDCHLFARLCGKNHLNLSQACLGGNMDMVKLIIKHSVYKEIWWNSALNSACYNGNMEIIQLMIQGGAININSALAGACDGGNVEVVKLLITYGATDWNWGLYGACKGGNMLMAQLMISKGANDWNRGLYGACRGGHMEMVLLMISRGASDWNRGLGAACRGGKPIAKLMIECGADKCDYCNRSLDEHI